MNEQELRQLIAAVKAGRVSRRTFARRMVGLGLTAPLASQLLAHAGLAQSPAAVDYKPTGGAAFTAAPICGQQRAPRWWLIGRSEDGTYCKIVLIWRPSAFDLVGRNIWTPRRNFAV